MNFDPQLQTLYQNYCDILSPDISLNDVKNYYGKDVTVVVMERLRDAYLASLEMCGVEEGEFVLLPNLSPDPVITSVIELGATPVFVDTEYLTWCVSPVYVEMACYGVYQRWRRPPVALLMPHLYGLPAMMNEVVAVVNQQSLRLVEDNFGAIGCTFGGVKCGLMGHYSVLAIGGSANPEEDKGILVCRDSAPVKTLAQVEAGGRAVCNESFAGSTGIEDYESLLASHKRVSSLYAQLLAEVPGVQCRGERQQYVVGNGWVTCVRIDPMQSKATKREILEALRKEGCDGCLDILKPATMRPEYIDLPSYGTGTAEQIYNESLLLPTHTGITNNEVVKVVNVIKKCCWGL